MAGGVLWFRFEDGSRRRSSAVKRNIAEIYTTGWYFLHSCRKQQELQYLYGRNHYLQGFKDFLLLITKIAVIPDLALLWEL